MKLNKIFIASLLFLGSGLLVGCSEDFLTREPDGSTVTQGQYESNSNSLEAHVRGMYRMISRYSGSSNHNYFSQKTIDIYNDLLSGDMCMPSHGYGWFQDGSQLRTTFSTSGYNSYVWHYYYPVIKNCNLLIANANGMTPATPEEANTIAYYKGQALALRAYCYFQLVNHYAINYGETSTGIDVPNLPVLPVYVETDDPFIARPLSTVSEVYNRSEQDLLQAIDLLDGYARPSKEYINEDIAKGLLAYLYLQRGVGTDYAEAARLAGEVIATNNYSMIDSTSLLTTGFNSVQISSWMWANDVTTETTGGLGSFWGHVDVYTYSYAYAGDYKQISAVLYDSIPATDKRKDWFGASGNYKYSPIWKFYTADGRKAGGDRTWLSDIHFMRIEEMYLIASEASLLNDDVPGAISYLQPLMDQRDPVIAANLSSYGRFQLRPLLLYNWRVELWGEGKSLMTFKRFGESMTYSQNRQFNKGLTVAPTARTIIYEIPESEKLNNPNIE